MPSFPPPRPPASEASSSSASKAEPTESVSSAAAGQSQAQQTQQTAEARKSATPDRGASTTPSKETTPSKPELHKDVPSTSLSFLPQVPPRPVVQPTSLSEWQLLAVLHKANLVQYYETFISKGGDDINQIMQCEEDEFLEIMNLVGMASKPLHVRRLQRALTEFSNNQTAFNLAAIQAIGPPPVPSYTLPATSDPISFLLPGLASSLASFSTSTTAVHSSTADSSSGPSSAPSAVLPPSISVGASSLSVPLASNFPSLLGPLATAIRPTISAAGGVTANIMEGRELPSDSISHRTIIRLGPSPSHKEEKGPSPAFLVSPIAVATLQPESSTSHQIGMPVQYNDFVQLGDFDPNNCNQTAHLSAAQMARLTLCAHATHSRLPSFQPRMVQNKKRVSKEILDLMAMPISTPNRAEIFRKYSAIYGRFDAKRKASKVLSLHEVAVNEAATQLCLLCPALLTRRDELFPLARQIVKDAGYHYAKGSRKRHGDSEARTPSRSPSVSPRPSEALSSEMKSPSEKQSKTDTVSRLI
ncbi:hypothetical protein WR25_21073 [Diploscapter pachys]|uniref:NAB co-repressor domain-containing protein n=1 Tax=Diploscapter pachys TaxID=2018661 RepID=A0A2A2KFC3_9BILA|nr:hypothetical protein WR25_21073 [Diploscapter pachys]